jgi:hypothetical protein
LRASSITYTRWDIIITLNLSNRYRAIETISVSRQVSPRVPQSSIHLHSALSTNFWIPDTGESGFVARRKCLITPERLCVGSVGMELVWMEVVDIGVRIGVVWIGIVHIEVICMGIVCSGVVRMGIVWI